ncbi:phage tail tube protein [Rhizobium oryzicola]|uniref:Phage tail tube protein n=1 Tax=Rhizobium oryzicola TaxID=1232668 RepID=A0ABT8SVG2_9HYPH|nr:phage tail tube protein [Rhizobium oryzicola]MDO1582430.1 phage tail tube protein [Rhizobium oryzicola]
MTDSNRLRLTSVRETTLGVTPNSPRMRTARITGESLSYKPDFVNSEELRSDRMNADPIKTNETIGGGINFEFSFPVPDSPFSDMIASLFFNDWVNAPFRDNDGTAGSKVTSIAATGGVIAVAAGAAFAAGHLVRLTGFGVAGNNGVFKLTTGSSTVPAVGNGILTDEASPPAVARVKVVGFEGASGDIQAVSDGLMATTLDFTTFGLVVGQWVKLGGSASGNKFATAALNDWARITKIAAKKLTLDNLPASWTTDSGAGKSIRVFFGDTIKNGTSMVSLTLEKGFMGQATPTYIVQRGMVAGQGEFSGESEQILKGSVTFNGMTGAQSTVSLDDTPDAATTNGVMSSGVNVARVAENGAAVTSPNFVKSASIQINNNLRMKTAVGTVGAVDIGVGECAVTVNLDTYFGNNAVLAKLLAGTPSNFSQRTQKDGQAVIMAVPRMTFNDGNPQAGGKNQDVMLQLTASASIDPLTSAHVLMDRLEYYEG